MNDGNLDRDAEPPPGDCLFLPAGTPHTVTQVSEGALWLAVHLGPDGSGEQSA